jgi:hypothetical protein
MSFPSRLRLQRRSFKPRVEELENRSLLSANFQVVATLGTTVAVPTGTAVRINDFEPGGLNNQGDIAYGDDLGNANDPSIFIGEGVFLRNHQGQETVLGSSTAPAPGGGTFSSSGFEGPVTLNAQGDAAVDFLLSPTGSPFGVNSGAYRYMHNTGTITPVVLPFTTPAPGGGTFQGVEFGPSLDNRGDLYFVGIIPTTHGVAVPDNPGLGLGIFKADLAGHITSVVSPGDPAPGGGTFDNAGETYATSAWVNGGGDIVFAGHVAGQDALLPGFGQPDFFATIGSLYIKSGSTGQITSIAHAGDPAPGGGVFRQALFGGINDRDDVVFTGDLTPAPNVYQSLGVFLYSGGSIIPIARPGDSMPGGGHLFSASGINGETHLNNRDDVVFNATLDTFTNGVADTGMYQWSHGQLSLIARTGTVIPGVGTVASVTNPSAIVVGPPTGVFPTSGAVNNDRGQVLFAVTLTNGTGVMLLAFPNGQAQFVDAQGSADAAPLTDEQLQPILSEAIAHWVAAGADPAVLKSADVQITSLPGKYLGMTAGNAVWIDQTAQGNGWFVDPTPGDDREFPAAPGSAAAQGIDLLTVVEHELGHVLGLPDVQDNSLMGETLTAGVRRNPTGLVVQGAAATAVLVVTVPGDGSLNGATALGALVPDATLPSAVQGTARATMLNLGLYDDRKALLAADPGDSFDLVVTGFGEEIAQDPLVAELKAP